MTRSGRLPLWRIYEVSRMSRLQKGEMAFDRNPPGYEDNDLMLSPILCQLT